MILGANDSGKTNLLMALRLLFDRSLSDNNLDLASSDYNAYTKADSVEITAYLEDVTEECLISIFKGDLEDNCMMIRYSKTKGEDYEIKAGSSEETMRDLQSRSYLRRLNMQYVTTKRDLTSFLHHERAHLLEMSMADLTDAQREQDDQLKKQIQKNLNEVNEKINLVNYIKSALDDVNKQLRDLSIGNEDQAVRLVAGDTDVDHMLTDVKLATLSGEAAMSLGGDGRNNQIFLATWIAEQKAAKNVDSVTFYAIEEPEAHLHPHQQRKLAEYLANNFEEQLLVTTHSPNIAVQFAPDNIIRLYLENKITHVASSVNNQIVKNAYADFGYRLNSRSAEILFSDGVFLVEGVSEVIFYQATAYACGLDLDRYNISILAVEGVGFKPYVALCKALKIPWVLRTDNDIFETKQKPKQHYYAGLSRAEGIVQQLIDTKISFSKLRYWKAQDPPEQYVEENKRIRKRLKKYGIFLADKDLETDLAQSQLQNQLLSYYRTQSVKQLVRKMQERKAENMFSFVRAQQENLKILQSDPILEPITYLLSIAEKKVHP